MEEKEKIKKHAQGIRRRVLEHVVRNNGGYLSQACSAAEILSALYVRVMRLGPSQGNLDPPDFSGVPGSGKGERVSGGSYNGPIQPDLDRFFLSPAHYALVLYTALIEFGRMGEQGLDRFNQDGSTVEMIGAEHSPGFELMGGCLAQTLSQAGGIALARKIRGETGRNWVFLSDGEFQEGQTWEAIQTLSHYALDNVGVYVDVNGQQCDGTTRSVMNIEPLASRIEAFGGRAITVDGHDIDALVEAGSAIGQGKPLFVLCYTDPCRGFPLLEKRTPKLHYLRFTSQEEKDEYKSLLIGTEEL